MNTLGKTIRLLRHQRGWTQEQVACFLDISIPAFSKIETGVTDMNLSRLEQIAGIFGLSVVELLTYQLVREDGQIEALAEAEDRLKAREEEIIQLQRKIILLFDQLREHAVSA